jgi:hypothetical protein
MKARYLIIIVITIKSLLIGACSGQGGNSEANVNKVNTSKSKNPVTINAEVFSGKLDELLTLEMAANASGFEASKATKQHENNAHKAFGGTPKPPRECNYYWDNGRKRTISVGDNTMQVPRKDLVGINWVSNTTLERFQRNYGALSDQQKRDATKQLEEEASKKASEDIQIADQKMMEIGSDMIQNLKAEVVTGVGNAAVWYENANELKVFHNGLTFALLVDISDDNGLNKAKSIDLANTIIREKLQ